MGGWTTAKGCCPAWRTLLVTGLLIACSWPALAAEQVATQAAVDDLRHWQPLPESDLADLRGGFLTEGGLQLAFGVERMVFINGALSSHTELSFGNLSPAGEGSATVDSGAWSGWEVVQVGSEQLLTPEQLGGQDSVFGTLIQNRLDDQQIQVVTQVNLRLADIEALRAQSAGQMLNTRLLQAWQ